MNTFNYSDQHNVLDVKNEQGTMFLVTVLKLHFSLFFRSSSALTLKLSAAPFQEQPPAVC